jgi:hypothetical protein
MKLKKTVDTHSYDMTWENGKMRNIEIERCSYGDERL